MIKGVIYDIDDLMVNSNPLHAEATEVVFKKIGHSLDELPEQMLKSFIGMRIVDILQEIIGYFKLDISFDDLYKERTDIFLKLAQEKLEIMPGLYRSLDLFRNNKYSIAVTSSGTKEYINLVLEKFNIKDYFKIIISGDDVKKGKPDPESYLLASKQLGLLPQECLVLEDATTGIAAAKGAGCKCMAIKNLNTPPQDHSKADRVINSLEEINLEILKSL